MLVNVAGVEVFGEDRLRLTYADGTVGDADLGGRTCVLEPLRDREHFARLAVDPDAGTIAWSDRRDMAPGPLYAEANLAHASSSC